MNPTLADDRPIYLQIKEAIEQDILQGLLKPGEQIPSNRQLVRFYGVNPMTALKATAALTDDALLVKRRGEGMYVADDAPDILRKRFKDAFRADHLIPLVSRAAALSISRGNLHTLIDQVWDDYTGGHNNDNVQ